MLFKRSMSDASTEAMAADRPLSVAQVVAIIRRRGWRLSKRPVLALLGLGEHSAGYRVSPVTHEHVEFMRGFTVMVHWENGPPASSYHGLYELQSLQRELEQLGYDIEFPGHVIYAKQIASATSLVFSAT
ncbi:MAG: hypothetical protein ACXWCY_06365 [Burkholderiales bacterium]